jgi:FkbH-like protein
MHRQRQSGTESLRHSVIGRHAMSAVFNEPEAAQLHDPLRAKVLQDAAACDSLALSTLETRRLSRRVRALPGERDVRIAFAGNTVLAPLAEFAEAHLACHGIVAASYAAPFGQALQELLDPSSGLHQFDPHFVFLHFELDALASAATAMRAASAAEEREASLEATLRHVVPVVRAAIEQTSAVVLVTNFVGWDTYELGLADARFEFGEQALLWQLNSRLAGAFRNEPRVQIVDLSGLTAMYGRARARDRRLYYVAKIPWHDGFLPVLADDLVRHIKVATGRVRKCLVVDLDNTLWDGVLGEDGVQGVRVGAGDPAGEAHFDLQRRILAIARRGVMLAACSKNNPADVDELFRVRTDMPLRRDHFACMEIGWSMKHEGLRRIAERLNIGTDSLVFLDDNPAEIELIRQQMPEVQCVLVPSDPALRPTCLDAVHSLDRAVITREDQDKASQYHQNAERDSARTEFADLHEYLHSLETRITIRVPSADMLVRAHQLFGKTNQFNVTTKRYSLADVQGFASDPTTRILMIRAEDRFGDLGWIGVVLLTRWDEAVPHVDSFILSCRSMGRGIESAILNSVKTWCFADERRTALTAEYLPTAKNVPVRDLFERHGFAVTTASASGHKQYRAEKGTCELTPCEWIRVEAELPQG